LSGCCPGGRWLALARLFAALVIADYRWLDFTRILDQRTGDPLLALNARQRPVSERVVVVDIDQRSLENMNDLAGSWPWLRSVHGELIEHIAAQKPRAIVFDILFNEPDVYRPKHDAAFAGSVARNPNVWLAMTLNADGAGAWVSQMPREAGMEPTMRPPRDARVPLMLPLVVAQQPGAMRGGLINFTADSDSVGRHHALWRERSGWRFPSLAAQVTKSLGRPLPGQDEVLLNWRSGWKQVSYADLYLDALRQKPVRRADELRDKIVVIAAR
jgi:adenylate cyclase